MALRKQFVVGGEVFKTKAALVERVREALRETSVGSLVGPKHWPFVYHLFQMHPDAFGKSHGEEFPEFSVQRNPFYGSVGFYVHREDGTTEDFSYKACLDGKPSPLVEFKKACRDAVVPDIRVARDRLYREQGGRCAVSGDPLGEDTREMHVDHAPPWLFDDIVLNYIQDKSVDVAEIETIPGSEAGVITRFKDVALIEDFRNYHNSKAKLRLVTKAVNVGLLRRKAQAA